MTCVLYAGSWSMETKALTPLSVTPAEQPQKLSEGAKQMAVYATLVQDWDFVRVRGGGAIYCRTHGSGEPFQAATESFLTSLARDAYLQSFGVGDVDKIKKTREAIRVFIDKEVDAVTSDIVKVAEGVYWDGELGELTTEQQSGEKLCFHELFNTRYPSKHIVQVGRLSKSILRAHYEETLEFLSKHRPDELPEEFGFITTWANNSHDVYMDLLRSISYCFLKKKPVGSYILIGERRNGKSSFVGMLHTIFGDQNTSMVRLSQLGDAHYTHRLLNSMLNAPDEEDDKVVSAQADFKSIADHGVLTVPVMRSNEPVTLQADFMCFYPMNHLPEWKGAGAGACLKRSLVIPFYADLSVYDTDNDDFAEKTFTTATMSKLMGVVFALANYYSHHPLEFSETMGKEQRVLEEEQDSAFEYRSDFLQYFDGFSTKRDLYTDYVNWCKTYDKKISTKREFDFLWREYMTNRSTYKIGSQSYAVYRLARSGHRPLHPALVIPELTCPRVSDMHEMGISVVAELDTYARENMTWGE